MATAMKEIQDKLSNQDKLRGLEKHTPKPLVHPKHDLINKWLGRLREHGFSLVLGFSLSAMLLIVTVILHRTPNHVFPQPNSFDLSNSPLLLQVGQLPDFSKEPTWDAVPSAMELAGEIPLANLGDDQYVPILGEDNLAEDRKKLEGKRADNESAQTPNDAPAGPEAPSTDANAIPAKPQCHGKQDCKVLNKKLAKMERKMWLSTKLEEKKRAHDAALSTENADDDASVSLGMDRSSTCKPGSAACTDRLDLTMSKGGVMCLIIFAVGYSMVMLEDHLGIAFKKSVPMTLATGMIWFILASEYKSRSASLALVSAAARHNLLEFSEVFLFLLVAMVYISTMEQMQVFESIKIWMLERGFGLKGMYWMCGLMAFLLAPFADSLTTALLVGAVAMKLMGANKDYVAVSCISIVVACNAGGVISPFGDVTSLMVWQKEKLSFFAFFKLLLPGVVNWLVPAGIMSFSLKDADSQGTSTMGERVKLHPEAFAVCSLFLLTILMSASFQSFVEIPAVLGMMTGLGLLMCYGMYYIQAHASSAMETHMADLEGSKGKEMPKHVLVLDIFKRMESCDWDTLLFFYGIIMSVGALGLLGYLDLVVLWAYGEMGPSLANTALGLISAFVDNIPVMFAVLSVDPTMSQQQWLLVTLTTGVGGSMLSVGSAAGVGLMGATGGMYRFSDHLKWTWAIALGYFLSIGTSLYINGS